MAKSRRCFEGECSGRRSDRSFRYCADKAENRRAESRQVKLERQRPARVLETRRQKAGLFCVQGGDADPSLDLPEISDGGKTQPWFFLRPKFRCLIGFLL